MVTGLGMLAVWALGVTAGEPTGFGGFPWGTPLGVVKEQLRGCASYAVITTVRGNQRYVGEHYDLARVGDVYLTLEFIARRPARLYHRGAAIAVVEVDSRGG